jgi:hypothetical protein
VVFEAVRKSLATVQTPIGEARILTQDEPAFSQTSGPVAPARLLPSGDSYILLYGADRELLVPDANRRSELWTPRVWPGGLVVNGEIAGTWRRANAAMAVHPWRRLSGAEREAVEAEANSLPMPGIEGKISISWGD